MKYTLTFFIGILLVAICCTPIAQSSVNSESNPKVLKLIDIAYEPEIKTVQLSPGSAPLQPSVTPLGKWDLLLRFDDLRSQQETYYAKVIHCNFDWTKSDLQDLDFLSSYNEFPIINFEYSVDTHIPYVHYTFPLP
ncbi:MAG TPA: type IX secretion system plug protein domain-containing protein, partial [Chryseolinea sp.]|nr:type IX secretion system plug protein domain-containing protein [Chryseolinea sp.]